MATINILGDIGASVQAEDIITQIQAAKGDKLKVLIASPGGSAFQGLMIHDALKASGKEVTTIALGLGASAAFIIFLAGDKDKREMGDSSLLMGHNSRTELAGTAAQIRDDLEAMDAIDDRMKAAVMAASGMSDEDATKLLSKDTFMNLETAMSLGLASGSIKDDIAASLNMNIKTKKEPVKMADEETKETGLIAFLKAFLKSEVKAEADDEKKPEDAKAESDDEDVEVEEEKETEDAKAEGEDPEKEEEAKAEGDDDKEKEEMKAKIESLESELAATKAKAEGDEDEKKEDEAAKACLIMSGITDKKVTMHTAGKLFKKSLSEVKSHLSDLESNATGRGKTKEPKADASGSKADQWKALKAEGNHRDAQKLYNKYSNEISSEMSKDK